MSHTVEATFSDRAAALNAVDLLLEAHVAARDILVQTGKGAVLPVQHRNHMAVTAAVGASVGLLLSAVLVGLGATQLIPLPVMAKIIGEVGIFGAALRLGFLGISTGMVAGALGGLRPRAEVVDAGDDLGGAHRIVVQVDESDEGMDALRASSPDRLVTHSD